MNSRFFFLTDFNLYGFAKLNGLSANFLYLWFLRCEGFNFSYRLNRSNLISYGSAKWELSQLNYDESFLLNVYLLRTLPVLLNLTTQLRFNMWLFYITKTYRGIAYKLNKPLRRKTRARTFYKPHMSKPLSLYKQSNSKSS